MELGTRELVQFCSLVATLAGAFAVVKSQLSRVIEDLKKVMSEMDLINQRLDTIESGSAVFKHQVNVLGNILSPATSTNNHAKLQKLRKN
jgi:hypothetical protein